MLKKLFVFLYISSIMVGCGISSAKEDKASSEKIHDTMLEAFNVTLKKVASDGINVLNFSRMQLLKEEAETNLKKVIDQGKYKGGEAMYNALVNELNYIIGTCTEFLKIERDEDLQKDFELSNWVYRAKDGMDTHENYFIDAYNNYETKVGAAF